jgi:hypothetical protein
MTEAHPQRPRVVGRQQPIAAPHRPHANQSIHDGRSGYARLARSYSHSIVLGGFDEMSSATRFTVGISLMIRLEIVSSKS